MLTADPKAQASHALQLFHAGQFQEALDAAQPLLAEAEVAPEMNHLLGACLHSLTRSEEALPYLRKAIALDASNPSYLNTLGVILRKLKRTEQAIRSYERVIALQPDHRLPIERKAEA